MKPICQLMEEKTLLRQDMRQPLYRIRKRKTSGFSVIQSSRKTANHWIPISWLDRAFPMFEEPWTTIIERHAILGNLFECNFRRTNATQLLFIDIHGIPWWSMWVKWVKLTARAQKCGENRELGPILPIIRWFQEALARCTRSEDYSLSTLGLDTKRCDGKVANADARPRPRPRPNYVSTSGLLVNLANYLDSTLLLFTSLRKLHNLRINY